MKVTVEPGLKSTLSKVHERTPEMVLHNRILRGVSLFYIQQSYYSVLRDIIIFVGFHHWEGIFDGKVKLTCLIMS